MDKRSEKADRRPNLLCEDFDNLRVIIEEQEYMLRPHQRDALSQLRAGKYTDSVSVDESKRLWYYLSTLIDDRCPCFDLCVGATGTDLFAPQR